MGNCSLLIMDWYIDWLMVRSLPWFFLLMEMYNDRKIVLRYSLVKLKANDRGIVMNLSSSWCKFSKNSDILWLQFFKAYFVGLDSTFYHCHICFWTDTIFMWDHWMDREVPFWQVIFGFCLKFTGKVSSFLCCLEVNFQALTTIWRWNDSLSVE